MNINPLIWLVLKLDSQLPSQFKNISNLFLKANFNTEKKNVYAPVNWVICAFID
jgi:hypothetical protein